jgi:FkbM family methyltransferase
MFTIKYGTMEKNVDVTMIVMDKMCKNNIICIPASDNNKSGYFGDPAWGSLKSIFIQINGQTTYEYDHTKNIYIDINNNRIYFNNIPDYIYETWPDIHKKLASIHSKLKLEHGSFNEEFPEQLMATRYLTGCEKVLEIGGNIGRNSLVIGSLIPNNNFVTMECDKNIADKLTCNRDNNNMTFFIENSALSTKKLIQKGEDTVNQTIVSDVILDGYKEVNIISYDMLQKKYNIVFDTLVLDCEGAFYYILMDMPEILNSINLIIMENDYHNIIHKDYIDNILTTNNFKRDYVESGGWGICFNNFYEAWKK